MTPVRFAMDVFAELPVSVRLLPILAGGALRSLFDGTEPKDYDLFFRSNEDFKETHDALVSHGWELVAAVNRSFTFRSPSGRLFNLVGFLFGDAEDQRSRFDFRCCAMSAHWDANGQMAFTADDGSVEDARKGLLYLRWNNGEDRTLRRINHYVEDYGYIVGGLDEAGDTTIPIGTREQVLRELVRRAPRGTGGY